jgi:hypothetical protein
MIHETAGAVVLGFHLVCMNVASAAPLVAIWLDWRRARRGDVLAGRAGSFLAQAALFLFLAGMGLGFVLAFLTWDRDQITAVLSRLPGKVFYGVWELVFSLVCLAAYAAWWRWSRRQRAWERWCHGTLAVLGTTNLLYHFPFFFVVAARVARSPDTMRSTIDAAAFRRLMVEGETLSLAVHFWLSSLAVSGVVLMLYGWWQGRKGRPEEDVARPVAWGSRIALVATLLQLPIGLWVLLELSPSAQARVMGGSTAATMLFVASLAAVLGLLHQLASSSVREAPGRAALVSAALMLAVVILMSGTLRVGVYGGKETRSVEETNASAGSSSAKGEWPRAQ